MLGEIRNAYKILLGNVEVVKVFGRLSCGQEVNIKIEFKEIDFACQLASSGSGQGQMIIFNTELNLSGGGFAVQTELLCSRQLEQCHSICFRIVALVGLLLLYLLLAILTLQ
jgi:hypothetical protein